MRMDLEGRIEKVSLPPNPPSNCLRPLFEAVVNAIHAVRKSKTRGKIIVHVERDTTQGVLREKEKKTALQPVCGFVIEDNGVGFTEENMESFKTADTLYKKDLGGKGVGRFMWLKAFEGAEIKSVFVEKGETRLRTFNFTIPGDGVSNDEVRAAAGAKRYTRVRLVKMRQPYRDNCPKGPEVIAGHIVQHCVEYLVQDKAPKLVLRDPEGEAEIDLNGFFAKQKVVADCTQFAIRERDFRLRHILLKERTGLQHEICFCANDATVSTQKLANHLPDLQAPIVEPDSGEHVIYHGYLSGEFLDETVTQERLDFHRITDGDLQYHGEVAWDEVVEATVTEAQTFVEPFTERVRENKATRIAQYVQRQAPQYRSLLKHRHDLVDRISPQATGNALDLELYKADQQYERELKEQAHQLLETEPPLGPDLEDYRERLSCFMERWTDRNRDQLAKYVAHRKAILSYLHDRLKRQADGRFALEQDIHQIIMPLGSTSDDVHHGQMNLWIIDERLAFHYYLASDKPLRAAEPLEVKSSKKPDLISFSHVFDQSFAFGDADSQFGSVVIVEFKRPMRDEYSDEDNPIQQVIEYVEKIKEGKAIDKNGRTLNVCENTPFYAYIICDLTHNLKRQAKQRDFKPTPDNDGYFFYHGQLGLYVEIISFDKLIRDARQRNAIFFSKLGLPPELAESTSASATDEPDAEKG